MSVMDLTSLSKALPEVKKATAQKISKESINSDQEYQVVVTHHDRCPECGGNVRVECRSIEKGLMTIYGRNGVRQALHLESRCQEQHCK